MRDALAIVNGQRRRFHATFERLGTKAFKNHVSQTLLFLNVQDVTARMQVTDHLWFPMSKAFQKLDLKQGDVVVFDARVNPYFKRSRNPDVLDDEHTLERDYKLSYPSNCRKLDLAKKIGALDLFC